MPEGPRQSSAVHELLGHAPATSRPSQQDAAIAARLPIVERALYLLLMELELDGFIRAQDNSPLRFAVSNAWSVLHEAPRASLLNDILQRRRGPWG
ncbi:hypothetical protein [Rhodovarius lipocyclicus]|uniref:hypothetical protein n=1 Tax=Rhodovarius lipocyclicus TaxID=268410 RepID=UPI0013580594|nr:hypothetical protein [Rhodovarius lipocyclicus]